jgi:ribosome-binding protein aMBF1 (putative translation factor)
MTRTTTPRRKPAPAGVKREAWERATPWNEVRSRLLKDSAVRFYVGELEERRRLALALADARKAAGVTQEALAARMGTTQSAVARFESGRAGPPSIAFLDRLAAALGFRVALSLDPLRRTA